MAGMVRGKEWTEDGRRQTEDGRAVRVRQLLAISCTRPRCSPSRTSPTTQVVWPKRANDAVTRSTAVGSTTARKPRPRLKVDRISSSGMVPIRLQDLEHTGHVPGGQHGSRPGSPRGGPAARLPAMPPPVTWARPWIPPDATASRTAGE